MARELKTMARRNTKEFLLTPSPFTGNAEGVLTRDEIRILSDYRTGDGIRNGEHLKQIRHLAALGLMRMGCRHDKEKKALRATARSTELGLRIMRRERWKRYAVGRVLYRFASLVS